MWRERHLRLLDPEDFFLEPPADHLLARQAVSVLGRVVQVLVEEPAVRGGRGTA